MNAVVLLGLSSLLSFGPCAYGAELQGLDILCKSEVVLGTAGGRCHYSGGAFSLDVWWRCPGG